jgi:hypothetical protein
MDWLRSEDLNEENMHLLNNHYSIQCILQLPEVVRRTIVHAPNESRIRRP